VRSVISPALSRVLMSTRKMLVWLFRRSRRFSSVGHGAHAFNDLFRVQAELAIDGPLLAGRAHVEEQALEAVGGPVLHHLMLFDRHLGMVRSAQILPNLW